jgi:glycerate dehydrogenase
LLLEVAQGAAAHALTVRQGRWAEGKADWCYWDAAPLELSGRTMGLVGSGRIAQAVARIGRALGMAVLFATRTGGRGELQSVLAASDVISLHCPLTADNRELICAETLGWMKPGAILINTSRGGLVNELDLADALNHGRLGGAGLDVLSLEPPPAGHPLLTARHCLITPHMAWAATSARARLLETAVANVGAFLAGRPQNVVN